LNSIEKALQKQQQDAESLHELQLTQDKPTDEASPPENSIEKALHTQPDQVDEQPQISQKTQIKSNKVVSNAKIEIDLEMLAQKGFVSTDATRQLINEEFRDIKRKLLANAFGPLSKSLKNSNVIMVTSCRQGEGKTFTAINLALSIALEQDKTVLLVDADVLRPNVMRTLELKNEQGLMEYLLGEKDDISEVMCRTNLDKLRIITAGKSHHLSAELLASERMFAAMAEFANRYTDRVVIFDTPPLLGINETAILANLAGQALIVTEEFKTKLVDVEKAVKHLRPEMAIGFIVNKTEQISLEAGGYGYYYAGSK
jgi:protein-tyrosine kinase